MKTVATQETAVHPMLKQHYLVSSKSVNYEDLSAFEAAAMALVFLLAVTTGVLMSLPVS